MACSMRLVRVVDSHCRLVRCTAHGIAVVEDGSTGSAHSAHPNIHHSGSVAGMVDQRYWDAADLVVRCHGWQYNVSQVVTSMDMDRMAHSACQCGGCQLFRRGVANGAQQFRDEVRKLPVRIWLDQAGGYREVIRPTTDENEDVPWPLTDEVPLVTGALRGKEARRG